MATMKKIILCVLLSFFFSIYSTTHVHSCRDPGIQTTGVATTGGVPDHSTGLPFHPWIMTVAANEKRRKQQQESLARCRGKEVLSQEQKEAKRLEQYREHNSKRRASAPSIELTQEQKEAKRLQQHRENNSKRRASAPSIELTQEQKDEINMYLFGANAVKY
jgi:hypothetical protein